MYNFNPESFLEIAKEICQSNVQNEEGIFRTCIGRAYYASFLSIREHLTINKTRKFGKDTQHQQVLDALADFGQYNLRNQLDTLRDLRVKADYYLNLRIDKMHCKKGISISERLLDSIETI